MNWKRPNQNLRATLVRFAAKAGTIESQLYLAYVGVATWCCARSFIDARTIQLGWANASRLASGSAAAVAHLPAIVWSAPLDDTFIHFDFARSFARMRPFEWTMGGGYSSGATSWLYPAVLALGIPFGFDGQRLGLFADLVACICVFAFLWAGRSLFRGLPDATSYLLAPAILTSGVLCWSLWSGMELALFLAIWALCFQFYAQLETTHTPRDARSARTALSIGCLFLVMTRPEALFCVGLFALFADTKDARRAHRAIWQDKLLILLPALGFTALRALVNLVLTGSFADAGAIVKLETLHPFYESREIALRWLGHVWFQFSRITVYHTTDDAFFGWQFWLLAVLGFIPNRTRKTAAFLWLSAIGWILIVAQNEYVRYQNDRYTMPAVAWLLSCAAIGAGGLLNLALSRLRERRFANAVVILATTSGLATNFLVHQLPRLWQQRWLFGRACRNIAEQQITVGQLFKAGRYGTPHRILLGDAGAIPFFSEMLGLDAIGLGGTHGLPFSRAIRLGVGATVELIEHLDPEDRPDKLAIYPSWWDILPVWFGRPIEETRIVGNVICGAANKVVYDADWQGLDDSPSPLHPDPESRIVDELDFADVLSESTHHYELTRKHAGYVVMKLLPHPDHPRRDIFDAGRLVFADTTTRFTLFGFEPARPVELIFRAAPTDVTSFRVRVDGHDIGKIEILGGDNWQEPKIEVPARLVRETLRVEIVPDGTEHILYHLWATSPR